MIYVKFSFVFGVSRGRKRSFSLSETTTLNTAIETLKPKRNKRLPSHSVKCIARCRGYSWAFFSIIVCSKNNYSSESILTHNGTCEAIYGSRRRAIMVHGQTPEAEMFGHSMSILRHICWTLEWRYL